MTTPDEHTPYRSPQARATRRRNLLILVATLLVVAVGLALHVAGVLPPK